MKNPKIILASIGGVTLVALAVLGWLVFDARSAASENATSLENAESAALRVFAKLPVAPGPRETTLFASNRTAYADWTVAAREAAAAGDLVFENLTPARFKAQMVDDARRFSERPGSAVGGKIVVKDFAFGFRDYVTGSTLPPARDVPRLQREWNDISLVATILATNGVPEIRDIRVAAGAADEAAEDKPGAKAKKPKKSARAAKGNVKPDAADAPAVTRFTVDFRAKPSQLVDAVNCFASDPRFIVVERFTFSRGKDELVECLGGDAKADAPKQTVRTRRRRGAAAPVKETTSAETAKGVVTDPLAAEPLEVSMTFAVYDFRTLEKAAAEEKLDEAARAAKAEKEAK